MCDGTGKYWLANDIDCKNCDGTGFIWVASPTTEDSKFWLEADGKSGGYSFGKWLLFVNKNKIDETWQTIQKETTDEKLSLGSKVSTKRGWVHHGMPEDYVICVYTDKAKEDIDRVRNRLRELGHTGKIGYKTNDATINESDELLYEE